MLPSRFLRRCLCRLSLCPLPFRGFGLRARLLRCGRLLLLGLLALCSLDLRLFLRLLLAGDALLSLVELGLALAL